MLSRMIIATLILQSSVVAGAGDLDTAFNNNGIVITDMGGLKNFASSIAVQSDGKIIVAGESGTYYNDSDFALARYTKDGILDTTFNNTGKVLTDIQGYGDSIFSTAIQNDGKIVAVGYTSNEFATVSATIVRYNSDGSLDTTFNENGKVIINSVNNYSSVVIQNDGKILVTGYSNVHFATIITRYNSNGRIDTTFNQSGYVVTSSDIFGVLTLGLQRNGKIVLSANGQGNNSDFILLRYNSDGVLDTTFGTDGIVYTDILSNDDSVSSMAIDSDDKIVIAGFTSGIIPEGMSLSEETIATNLDGFAVLRYNSNGSLDTTFGNNGIVVTGNGLGSASSVVIQKDGKIVAAGTGLPSNANYADSSDFSLVRYNYDGSLDTTFNKTGIVFTNIDRDYVNGIAIQENGKIVAAGYSRNLDMDKSNFVLLRYQGRSSILSPIYYLLQ